MKLKTHHRADRRGATVVEMTFVLMVALILTMAIYDYSRYFMLSQLVNNAAREGARQAAANTNTQNTAMIQSTVINFLANQNYTDTSGGPIQASDVIVQQVNPATGQPTSPDSNWYDAPFGSGIMVRVTARFNSLFPGFGFLPTTVTVTGTSVMSSEAN
jgi:Flp pilus assembly protein TadG